MAAAVTGVDTVGEGVYELGKAVVVLEGRLDDGTVDLFLHVYGVPMYRPPVLVEVADKAGYAAIEVVRGLVVGPEVGVPVAAEANLQALVKIGHLLETLGEHAKVVIYVLEYLRVGHEGDDCARLAIA